MNKFDKDKYLKKLKFKRNLTKYGKYFYIGVPCMLAVVAGIYFAYSKFTVSKDVEVVKTTVGKFIHGDVVIGAYINGEYSNTIPGKNDGYVVKSVSCDNNATGSWDKDAWGIALTNMTKRTKCNIYFETKKNSVNDVINEAVNTNSSMFASDDADKNVRYIGADPSNYVYFNCSDYTNPTADTCELWRIIGVFNNVTKSDGSKENLVKIIRDESIGNIAWDSNNVNDWSTATLQQNLNSGTYYTTTLKNDTTRNAIEEVVWNLGGSSTYYNVTPSMFYKRERGTTVHSGRPTTWTGKIGLMYPSDYGYATSGGTTKDRVACLAKELYSWDSSDFSDCKGNDYLFDANNVQWTLAPDSTSANYMFGVYKGGHVGRNDAYYTRVVRPALFLKSNIQVDKGTGAKSDPYQLKMQ